MVGHIEDFFALMSHSIELMGHKKKVLIYMSQSKGEEGHKNEVLIYISRNKRRVRHIDKQKDLIVYVHTNEWKGILK